MLPSHNCIIISNVQFSRCSLNLLYSRDSMKYQLPWCFSQSLWWRVPGSNRWPPACKAGALPAELTPQIVEIKSTFFNLKRASNLSCVFVSPLNFKPALLGFEVVFYEIYYEISFDEVVGQNGLEPSTSRLSVVCSSQLSYWPISASLLCLGTSSSVPSKLNNANP